MHFSFLLLLVRELSSTPPIDDSVVIVCVVAGRVAAVAGRVAVVADLLLEGDFIIGSPLKSTPHLIWPCH